MILYPMSHALILAGSRRLVKAPRRPVSHGYGLSWGPLTNSLKEALCVRS